MNLKAAFVSFHNGERKSKILEAETKEELTVGVIRLFTVEMLTLKEIAVEMDISKGKVRNILRANGIDLKERKKEV